MPNAGVAPRGYYDAHYRGRKPEWYAGLLAQAVTHSRPGPILDVGAGLGLLVEAAMNWGIDAEGVDGSDEAVALAVERNPDVQLRQHFLSEPLPYADERFQTVFMYQVIEHLEPEIGEFALQEAYRVLCPLGLLIVASPSKYNRYERHADETHINLYAPNELKALISTVGFQTVVSENAPRLLLGSSRPAVSVMSKVFRLVPWQRLSATANYLAWKTVEPDRVRRGSCCAPGSVRSGFLSRATSMMIWEVVHGTEGVFGGVPPASA